VAFLVIDLLTPGKLWDELSAKQNSAVAIVIGCVAIALGIIVAAAIH
jgi:putative membrane protein